MAFPLEKILTVSARDYCEAMGKRLADYELVGVHARNGFTNHILSMLDEVFAQAVPLSAEVVVEYKIAAAIGGASSIYTQCYAYGTALIPRNNGNKLIDENDLNDIHPRN
jgi:hypothetical protein